MSGRIRQSVCKWCYGDIPLDAFCARVKPLGIESVELLGENEWETVKRHGLTVAVANGPGGTTHARRVPLESRTGCSPDF